MNTPRREHPRVGRARCWASSWRCSDWCSSRALALRLRVVCGILGIRRCLHGSDATRAGAYSRTCAGGNMIATDSTLQTFSFYVNGKWTNASGRPVMPITNPATGAEIAQVAYASAADVDRTVRSPTRRSEVARRPGSGARAAAVPLQGAAREARQRSGRSADHGERQDHRRRARRGPPRHPDGRSGLRHARAS